MFRLNTIVITLGTLALTAVAPFAVRAQSGDALAHAETLCLDYGIGPHTVAFETCVDRTAQAFDRGEPALAGTEASKINEASKACLANDIEPLTLEYRQCMASEADTITASRYAAR